jgi:hypothetical protein
MAHETNNAANGLICAYDRAGRGGGGGGILKRPPSPGRTRWVHLDYSQPDAISWLSNHGGIDKAIADALLDDDSRPQTIEHGTGCPSSNAVSTGRCGLIE